MKINKLNLFAIIVALLLVSCKGGDTAEPEDVITDSEGIDMDLEWSTGGSISQSTDDVNLDLIVYKGDTQIDKSSYWWSYENVELESIYQNGTYKVYATYQWGSKDASWTLYLKGKNGGESYSYKGTLTTNDKEQENLILTIVKSGNEYTITEN